MYFQTDQVIFVPEWPKGEFVSILASFCVWTKSLICKDATNRNSTVQSEVRRNSSFLSAFRTMYHPVRTPDSLASSVWMTCFFCPDTSLYREVYVPTWSVRTSQHHVRMPISSRTVHWFFPNSRKGRSINRPDNVVSRSDAWVHKASIAFWISPSERLTAVVRTLVHRIW
jgi:hypothetical protein